VVLALTCAFEIRRRELVSFAAPAILYASAEEFLGLPMIDKAVLWLFRVLEVMFFAGLIGCAAVVIISWVSIFKSGFSKD
jgi:hypothetical protein